MKTRMNIDRTEPGIYKAMGVADNYISGFEVEPKLLELIRIRVSQINGCGYCINQHTEDALRLGETTQRLMALAAWWETPFFRAEERAALKFVEELTNISEQGVSDETYGNVLILLGTKQLAQIIFAAVTVNSWNRIAISMHMIAGE